MNKKVVTFGEIMLRLSTKGFSRFIQAQNFDVTFGGGEANVSVALANFGLNSFFVTSLPNHEIGQSAVNHLRRFGVNTNSISRKGDRIGIYFLETGASQRASKVIYDRANSAIANVERKDFDWENILENCTWFHWTGITPAIGKNVKLVLKDALETAKSKKIKVSCDLNFRKKMWSTEEAQKVMIPLMEYVDVCIANEEDAEKSLGEKLGKTQIEKAAIDEEGYFKTAESLKNKYDFEAVAITLRESFSASRNGWSAILLDNKNCKSPYRSKKYDIQIVDRVGGGDSFASGLIYGLLNYENTKNALEFAVGASCLKQTIPGDFNLVTVDEVEKLIKGDGSGRVER
ncbi:MAG: sugar kinase [Ignavibacteriales bacterium]|nr:sugar kinase [Ignavibacteriales bacterium]